MFYYAELNSTLAVTAIHALNAESTNANYVAITEDQYTNGNLVGKYYNKLTGSFEALDIENVGYIGDTIHVQVYGTAGMLLSTKLDNMQVDMDGKADAENLSEVATSGSYNDLTDKPTIPAAYTHPASHPASMITGLSTVATSGSYNDLSDKPTIPTVPTSLPANGGNADTVDGKHASDFATASHNHDADYAEIDHTHTQYAAASHTHSGYASATHDHDEDYAAVGHTHDYAGASHTHAQSEITGLETALSGKANASHTHSQYASTTDVAALQTAVDGKASASHTHTQYATTTEVDALETEIAGKANAAHTHTLDNVTDTTSYVRMTPAERTKLSGIATGANKTTVDSEMSSTSTNPVQNKVVNTALGGKVDKVDGKGLSTNDYTTAEKNKLAGIAAGANAYTHPSTHAASMITGLATVATSGSYDDLSNKPTTMTPSAHTHAQSDISGLSTALSGKANTSHTHAQTDITGLSDALAGKANASHTHNYAATSHTHTAEALIAMASALFFTNSAGGVEYSYGSGSGKNVLTEISNMPQGFHTIYAIAGTTGNPETSESYRYYLHKTSSTIGWILAFGADGSIYSNYQSAAGTFKGWRTIHDTKRKPLWTGSYYMTAGHTATPSKKLSECEHGWLLLWSDYDPDTSTVNNSDFATTMIPNRSWAGANWNGAAFYCDVPRYSAGTATDSESRVIKVVNVYDNKIVGSDNNNAAPRNDVILRAIYEF